jgi:putative peptidoglycan lipid II flippase
MSKLFGPQSPLNPETVVSSSSTPTPLETYTEESVATSTLPSTTATNIENIEVTQTSPAIPTPSPQIPPRFNGGIVRAAMVISFGNILTRIFGLLRESVLAALFGTQAFASAFIIADNTLSIFFDLLVNGAISAALVPVLSRYAANAKDRQEFWKIVNTLLTLGTILLVLIIAVLQVFADPLARFMSAGNTAEVQDLTVQLVRVILFAILFLGISSIIMAALQAMQKFAWSALSLVARNGSVVLVAWFLGGVLQVWSLVIGVLLGTFMLIVLQVPGLKGNRFVPNFDFKHPAIAEIWRLYRPIFFGLVITSAALIIDRNLASSTGLSSIGAMRYATTLQQFALGLVGTAISIAILPTLSRQANEVDFTSYRYTLVSGLRLLTVLIIPATLGLLALAIPTITLLYQRNNFVENDKWLTLVALLGYLPGLPAAAYDQMLIVAFYARKNTLTPVLVGVGSNLSYLLIALSLTKIFQWGMLGLVLANSAQQIVHMSVMLVLLRRLFGKNQLAGSVIQPSQRLTPVLLKTLLASLLMATSAFLIAGLIAKALGSNGLVPNLAALIVSIGAAGLIYLGCLRLLKVEEIGILLNRIGAKLLRRA